MVSTHSSQYITDFTPTTAEPGKSPLALLAKTCETIGLPEGSAKKSIDKKETTHHHLPHQQQQQQKPKSPRSTPQSKEPTLTFPGLPKPPAGFPMGMPAMGFPFFNPMMAHYQMPFPGAFPMAPAFAAQRMPCPFAMMRQPCANPGCLQCPGSSNSVKNGQMSAEMMAQFAAHPLFSMYAGMMPGVPPASYQALLAASAAATSTTPTDYSMSKPSTSSSTATTSPTKPSESKTTTPSPTSPKRQKTSRFSCNWVDSDVPCGKSFDEESELTSHVKKTHAPSPSSSSTSSEPSTSSSAPGKAPRSETTTPQRFNPYAKPSAAPTTMMTPMGLNMAAAMNPLVLPFSLQAMYSQRLMPTVAHQ